MFLGGILGSIGGIAGKVGGGIAGAAKGAGGVLTKMPGQIQKIPGAVQKVAPKLMGGKPVAKTSPSIANVKTFAGGRIAPSAMQPSIKPSASGGRDFSDIMPKGKSGKGGKSKAPTKRDATTDTKKDKKEKTPAPDLPSFTPDYGVEAVSQAGPGIGPRRLIGMKRGSSIVPIDEGNPLHYHTHIAGKSVPKSSKPKLGTVPGSGKRSSKSTLHYKGK